MQLPTTARATFLGLSLLFATYSAAHAQTTVNINTADAATLATLSGIGAARAQAIVDYREANGAFTSVDDLVAVSGVGDATVEANRALITLE